LEKLLEETQETAQKLKKMQQQSRNSVIESLLQNQEANLIIKELPVDPKELRAIADETVVRMDSGVLALGCRAGGKAQLIIRVTDDCVKKGLDAKKIIQEIAPIIGGSGGGKPNGAQAGGTLPDKVSDALSKVRDIIA